MFAGGIFGDGNGLGGGNDMVVTGDGIRMRFLTSPSGQPAYDVIDWINSLESSNLDLQQNFTPAPATENGIDFNF